MVHSSFSRRVRPVGHPLSLLNPERYYTAGYEDFLLYVSRLAHHKRQWLAIESLRYTKTAMRLVIAGAPDPDSAAYADALQHMVKKYKLSERVTIIPRWINDEEKLDLYARCRAVLYFPFDEDSYGYPSLEAHHSGKPVLTTTDSGGTRELIEHGRNGFLMPPDPQLIAEAMDALYSDIGRAREMGIQAQARVAELGISWDRVADGLLS
jgi:glycosyltransferase involved in cell wall biosynthesis